MRVQFASTGPMWTEWGPHLRAALEAEGVEADVSPEHAPEGVDVVLYAPEGAWIDLSPYTSLKAVQSLWAGVDRIADNPTLEVPLARMVDPGMTRGMVEYVTAHVLRHHLGTDAYVTGRAGWTKTVPPLAEERVVGVLGLGALGGEVARTLASLGFDVRGWSGSPKDIEGVSADHGPHGLGRVLEASEIVVTLLPLTPDTRHVLNARTLARLPLGAVVINPGRGELVDEGALLAALDTGALGHATLDTFAVEPLPPAHPYWRHPGVTVTPHIASATRARTAAPVVAANLRRLRDGEPMHHLVDLSRGY